MSHIVIHLVTSSIDVDARTVFVRTASSALN